MPQVRAVILDMDGTLVDSNDAHAKAWVEALKKGGYDVPFEKARRLIGMGADNFLPNAVNVAKDTPEGQQLSQWWEDVFKQDYLEGIQPFPQSHDLLQKLRDAGLRLMIGSSGKQDLTDAMLEKLDAKNLVEGSTSSDEVKASKPNPDIVNAALQKLNLKAEETAFLGDTPYDVEAANQARVAVVALRCGGWNDEDFQNAAAVYQDPADLLAKFDHSLFVNLSTGVTDGADGINRI